ncbi:hypothetical protein BJ742DRAFT_871508 [Cladochytrium replicatum]|nr:hypothetical protein BJ742DRAFT_871508 [Cladochytrium replicatum]
MRGVVRIENCAIPATDNFPIVASRFSPSASDDEGLTDELVSTVVVIQSALGTSRKYYHDFALYLVVCGVPAVYTYDLRGLGDSLFPTPENLQATRREQFRFARENKDITVLDHWVFRDQIGVLQYVRKVHPHSEIVIVGNSLGAQLSPAAMVESEGSPPLVSRCLWISASNTYYRYFRNPYRIKIFGHYILPSSSKRLGFTPAKVIGLAEHPLPLGVGLEWFKATNHPRYFCGISESMDKVYKSAQGKVLSLSFEDDHLFRAGTFKSWLRELGSRVEKRWVHFTIAKRANLSMKELILEGRVGGSVGHLKFFKEEVGGRLCLWEAILPFLITGKFPEWSGQPLHAKL